MSPDRSPPPSGPERAGAEPRKPTTAHEGITMSTARARLLLAAERAVAKSQDPTRRKCFLSYHRDDTDEVEAFIDSFGGVFIPRVIGVTDEDDFIDSTDTD